MAIKSKTVMPAVMLCSLALFAVGTLVQGYDLNWDVLNYHFYNGWAVLHHTIWSNVQPAMRQSYFPPGMDLVFAWLVGVLPAMDVALVLAAVQSLAGPLLFLLAERTLSAWLTRRDAMLMAGATALLGVISPVSILEVGGIYGDNISAVPVLAALILVACGASEPVGHRAVVLSVSAGVLSGCAFALKLTNAPFVLGVMAALAVSGAVSWQRQRHWRSGVPALLGLGAGAVACVLLYGIWGVAVWQHFGNPFFPSFNNVFRSGYAAPASFTDRAFALHGWAERLAFPFVRNPAVSHDDFAGLFDVRLAVALPLAVAGLIVAALRRTLPVAGLIVLVFFLVSYVAWQWVFAINRYMLVLELVAPLVCAISLIQVCAISLIQVSQARSLLVSASLGMLVLFAGSAAMSPALFWRPGEHRKPDGRGYFDVTVSLPDDFMSGHPTVAMLGDQPTAFILPFFPRGTHFLRLAGSLFYESPGYSGLGPHDDAMHRSLTFGNDMGRLLCQRLGDARGDLYVLRTEPGANEAALQYFGLSVTPGSCRDVHSKAGFAVSLCKAARVTQPECG